LPVDGADVGGPLAVALEEGAVLASTASGVPWGGPSSAVAGLEAAKVGLIGGSDRSVGLSVESKAGRLGGAGVGYTLEGCSAGLVGGAGLAFLVVIDGLAGRFARAVGDTGGSSNAEEIGSGAILLEDGKGDGIAGASGSNAENCDAGLLANVTGAPGVRRAQLSIVAVATG